MPKGFFTQAAALLLRDSVDLAEIKPLMSDCRIVKEVEAAEDWSLGGPSLTVEYRPAVNGYISIDVVAHRWPDHMGDPEQEPTLFAA